ncbi:MAG TPA: hypothetical protein VFK02_07495 [Kofleriaceae bacterium]|nr:hypothetical protein [Kofleriaceae bacterium]
MQRRLIATAGAAAVVGLAVAVLCAPAYADRAPGPAATPVRIAAVAPAEDARKAVVIGAAGEVYEPDGKGAWVHRLQSSTADAVVAAGRAGGAIVAAGQGVVYRLAANGWSAIRLVQHGKAVLGAGARSLAAVGRQLFALDQLTLGEPTRLAVAPANIVGIGAGPRTIVLLTEAGAFKLDAAGGSRAPRLVALPAAPRRLRLVSDRWAISDRGALDLTTAKLIAWPSGLAIGVAAAAPDDALAAIGASRGGLELVTLRAGKLSRDPLGLTGTAVGVVVDRAGRAVVALDDGRIAVREQAGWTVREVRDDVPAEHPGAPAATSN